MRINSSLGRVIMKIQALDQETMLNYSIDRESRVKNIRNIETDDE